MTPGIIFLKNHISPASFMAWSTIAMALPMFIPERHNKAAARYSAAFLRATLYLFLSLRGGRSTTSLISFGALGDWQIKWKKFNLFTCDHCCWPKIFTSLSNFDHILLIRETASKSCPCTSGSWRKPKPTAGPGLGKHLAGGCWRHEEGSDQKISKANPKTSLETSSNKKRPKMLLAKSSTNRAADSISKGGWPRSNFWLFKASQATFSLVSIKKFEEATQKTSISSQTPVLFTSGVHGLRGEDCQQVKLVRPKKIGKKNWNGVELRKFSSPCPTKPAWRRWSSRQAGCPSPWEIEECLGVVLGVTHPSFGPTRKVLDFILGFLWCQPMPTPHLKTTSPSENGTRRRRQNLVLTSAMVSPARLSKNYIISHNMD